MQYTLIAPGTVNVTVGLPASKSISNRALVLHALSKGSILPENLSDCDDTFVMIRALEGDLKEIDIMAAGTAMRFLTAYLSVTLGEHLITGTARMQQRPIRILVEALQTLGADITYEKNEGYPPLRIVGGKLEGKVLQLPGNVSSQYISALLMIAPTLPQGLQLELTGSIISRPYINLTLQLMKAFGAEAGWSSDCSIVVKPGKYQDVPFLVENDWSAASYWYQILALSASRNKNRETVPQESIELTGLFPDSHQGDSRGAEVFAKLGIQTTYTSQGVRLTQQGEVVERLEEDMVDIPDLAQTFVVTCCLMGVPFRFTGLQSLKIKETDRINALQVELRKLGYVVLSEADSVLYWDGERCEPEVSPVIDTYEDHRMAMAFAPACIVMDRIQIANPEVVSKSYPRYWEDLKLAGFVIK